MRHWGPRALVGLFVVQAALRLQSDLVHDTAWFIHVAQGVLEGKELYRDFVEVNPPLALWLSLPPVWLAGRLALNPVWTYDAFVFALTAGSLALCFRYQASPGAQPDWRARLLLAAALLYFPGANFAEREHFVVLFFAPWLMLRMADGHDAASLERVAIGLLAAVAISLKPQGIFAPVLVESLIWARHRSLARSLLAPENLAVAGAGLAYVAGVALFVPHYFTEIVPLARKAYAPYFGYPAQAILANAIFPLLFVLIGALNWRYFSARLNLAAAVGFLAAYVIQQKGFEYQLMPATVFAFLAATHDQDWRKAWPALPALLGAATGAAMLVQMPQLYQGNQYLLLAALAERPDARTVFIASVRLSEPFPLVLEKNCNGPRAILPNGWRLMWPITGRLADCRRIPSCKRRCRIRLTI